MTASTIRGGARIETTGEGRTARWPHWLGTVSHVRNGRVFARMDGARFSEEEFAPTEVQLYVSRSDSCPCAQCDGSH